MEENRDKISKDPSQQLNLSKQMIRGLSHLHEYQIYHRDLKPENILVKYSETFPILKIGDFGVSKLIKFDKTQTATIAGTVKYMAPEMKEAYIEGKVSGQNLPLLEHLFNVIPPVSYEILSLYKLEHP